VSDVAVPATRPGSYKVLRDEIAALIAIDPTKLAPDDSLLDWGMDSVRAMTYTARLTEAGVEIALMDFAESPTLRYLAGRIGIAVPAS
jgi:bifunctional isochorismate lyase/aryl carrier protein